VVARQPFHDFEEPGLAHVARCWLAWAAEAADTTAYVINNDRGRIAITIR